MTITAVLRKDHEVLRRKLETLEGALQVAPQAPHMLRELCFSLAKLLNAHIAREARAVRPYRHRLARVLQERTHHDHANQRLILRDLNALLRQGHVPTSVVASRLSHLIDELREHFSEEERYVFPCVDHAEALRPEQAHAPEPLITEGMSANAIVRTYPETAQVLERHGICCGIDGCDCLDELAWRRGLDVDTLLAELRAAAKEGELASAPDALVPAGAA